MARSKADKTIHKGSLQARLARLNERVRRLETIVSPGWPHSIVDDEKEAPGAGWVLPEEVKHVYYGHWNEYMRNEDKHYKITNQDIMEALWPYMTERGLYILRKIRGE